MFAAFILKSMCKKQHINLLQGEKYLCVPPSHQARCQGKDSLLERLLWDKLEQLQASSFWIFFSLARA